jgi:SpoVK/Ycf46/Vps4 family AAA+-type ATPase
MPAHPSVISALTAAVEATPDDLPLRLHLGSLLLDAGEHARALDQFVAVLTRAPDDVDALRGATAAAEALGEHTRAEGYRRLLRALRETEASPPAPSDRSTSDPRPPEGRDDCPVDWDRLLGPRRADGPPVPLRAVGSAEEISAAVETPEITLTDVGGMGEVKRRLNLAFLAPLRNPELMRMYGKSLRGGLMLYGPPGCGKTYIARALAGELGAKFIAVGLADVLDMWLGESEKRLQQIFDTARRTAPSVLFFDEIDALGQKRSHLTHHAGRNVVNQLLAELDSIGGNNDGVFVLAATNHPWDVDTALRRPGRFDRMMLVLPPDEPAREVILHTHLKGRPADGVDTRWVAAKTQEFSGADLAHLCEAAAEHAMEESISTGRARPITTADFRRAMKECRPSTRPWFEVARNYAMFANEGGTYDELLEYLRANKI